MITNNTPAKEAMTSQKMSLFCDYMYTPNSDTFDNGVESARKAGYSGNDNTLAQTAHKLVRNGKVIARKAEIQAVMAENWDYSIERYRQELAEEISKASKAGQHSAAITGIVAKGRSCGFDKDNDMATDLQQELDDNQKAEAARLASIRLSKDIA